LRGTKQAGALEYDRVNGRNVVSGRVDTPAAGGGTDVPKRDDRVASGARGDVGTAAAAAGDGVDGLEGPGVGKGEGGTGAGLAHVVHAHEAVEPARDDDLVRSAPWGRGGRGGDAVHGGGTVETVRV